MKINLVFRANSAVLMGVTCLAVGEGAQDWPIDGGGGEGTPTGAD